MSQRKPLMPPRGLAINYNSRKGQISELKGWRWGETCEQEKRSVKKSLNLFQALSSPASLSHRSHDFQNPPSSMRGPLVESPIFSLHTRNQRLKLLCVTTSFVSRCGTGLLAITWQQTAAPLLEFLLYREVPCYHEATETYRIPCLHYLITKFSVHIGSLNKQSIQVCFHFSFTFLPLQFPRLLKTYKECHKNIKYYFKEHKSCIEGISF